jgi:hypothetical protein
MALHFAIRRSSPHLWAADLARTVSNGFKVFSNSLGAESQPW